MKQRNATVKSESRRKTEDIAQPKSKRKYFLLRVFLSGSSNVPINPYLVKRTEKLLFVNRTNFKGQVHSKLVYDPLSYWKILPTPIILNTSMKTTMSK